MSNLDRKTAPQRGFTLLEMLMAVGLTTLLMAALYSAMSIYYTTAVESYDEIERVQIARALLREIARDIQSCTFIEAAETEAASEDENVDSTESVDAETALGSYTNGLFGTEKDLVLYISRPDPGQNYVTAEQLIAPSDRSSDAIIIRYLLAETGGSGLAGQFAGENEDIIDDPVKGLARMQGDLLGLSNAISLGDIAMQSAATDMLAAEVAAVSFTYFDGVEELTEWDSTVQNAMPLAIVVKLTLRTLPNPNDNRDPEQVPGFLNPTVHQLVVPIPVARPYVEEPAI